MSRSHARSFAFAAVAVVLGVVATLAVLEASLRLLPVRESLETRPVNDANPHMHFRPDRNVTYSAGWNFAIVNNVHANNYGFINNLDYDPAATTPLLAVIGDSYVEALMVPYEDTLHARLARHLGPHFRVYSFGASGSALSQYLAYASYVRDTFRPARMVIVVVGNDFDESLMEFKSSPGFHYLRRVATGELELELVPFQPSLLGRAMQSSALARYLAYNTAVGSLRHRLSGSRAFAGNTFASTEPHRVQESKDAIQYFLSKLPEKSGLTPRHIAIVVDGMRPELYDAKALEAATGTYFAIMRNFLLEAARERGYNVIDMQPRFIERYGRKAQRFEWGFDGHWNSIGHEEAAIALIESRFVQQWAATPER